jgi:DNA-binding NarL/FixJ family response regulator
MQIVVASAQLDLIVALGILLREEPGAHVVGTASEAASLRALLHTSRPEMVLLDWDLPGHPPASLVAEAKRLSPHLQVLVLGKDTGLKQAALASGADAFFVMGDAPRPLLTAIRQAQAARATAANQTPKETKGE